MQNQLNPTTSTLLNTDNSSQNNVNSNIPYPEPVKTKFSFKQQPNIFIKDSKLQCLSIFPNQDQKINDHSKRNSKKHSDRMRWICEKAHVLIKECSTMIFYDIAEIIYNIIEILAIGIIFICYTIYLLYHFTKEILYYSYISCILPILIIFGIIAGVLTGMIKGMT
ncbi:hypothetical protein KGF54_003843 [Candida jiufengensis]|uniref:uncharacterized protein n=1 Tax=Candida jiufengensis TaxID=497108 RepID=UPI0022241C08|nr:uncharacterized protein KGF54_003843 [Candida jiufengensis]KAI5950769.1 hypothetical protein KGF54_003843 [Candida jiufengensis]